MGCNVGNLIYLNICIIIRDNFNFLVLHDNHLVIEFFNLSCQVSNKLTKINLIF